MAKLKSLIGKNNILIKANSRTFNHYAPSEDKEYLVIDVKKTYEDEVHIKALDVATSKLMSAYANSDRDITIIKDAKRVENLLKKVAFYKGYFSYSSTIGSDPEIFVTDKNDNVIPAFKFLGPKSKPTIKVGNRYGIYWDGYQAEFETEVNICLAYHCDAVQRMLEALNNEAKKYSPDARLNIKSVIDIPMESLENEAEEHVQFGCMPSFNAYKEKSFITNGREVPFRMTGGHIHFGIGKQTKKQANNIVKALDAISGIVGVSLFASLDDPRRRRLYGRAGEYRLPKHGLEYRVLSNAWLCHPMIMHLTFDLARKALDVGRKDMLKYFWKYDEKKVRDIINSCDVKGARALLKKNKKALVSLLASCEYKDPQRVYKLIMEGVESVINPESIEDNWSLNKDKWANHSEAPNCTVKSFLSNEKKAA